MESNGTMKVGVWNHITITYDGKLLRIYIMLNSIKKTLPVFNGIQRRQGN